MAHEVISKGIAYIKGKCNFIKLFQLCFIQEIYTCKSHIFVCPTNIMKYIFLEFIVVERIDMFYPILPYAITLVISA